MSRNLKRRTSLKSVGATVTRDYASSGTYTATLPVTDDDGATGIDFASIAVGSDFFGHCDTAYNYELADAGRAYQDTSTGVY